MSKDKDNKGFNFVDPLHFSTPKTRRKKKKKKSSILSTKGIGKICIIIIIVVILYAVTSYIISDIDVAGDELIEAYNSIGSNEKIDSKSNFPKVFKFLSIYRDEGGSLHIGVNDKSESEFKETLGEVAEDSSSTEEDNSGSTSSTVTLSASAKEVEKALLAAGYTKAPALAMVYDILNPILGTNAVIGLMANINHEGNFGVVEYWFSKDHEHNFRLPSNKSNITIFEDINYLHNWDSVDQNKYGYKSKKGSCGIGVIQWSFGRRVAMTEIYKKYIKCDEDVTVDNLRLAEAEMMTKELQPGTTYYNTVSSHAGSGTCEEWAESFCDYYERAGGSCGKGKKMTQDGAACRERRATATKLAEILKGLN